MLWSGVWESSDEGCGEGVLACDCASVVRQLLTSPVAPECAIDDDSNGSIARDRFNLTAISTEVRVRRKRPQQLLFN